jgi:radical SAM-linked protein
MFRCISEASIVADARFRLRINYRKQGRARFLSHLELVRALERMVRRARLPYIISQGFNAHMRFAPGPALPVGTEGLDEYFDVWLSAYLPHDEACARLRQASVQGLDVIGVSYVDPRLKGLQATHVREDYELLLFCPDLDASALDARLRELACQGSFVVVRKGKEKRYDLTRALARPCEVRPGPRLGTLALKLFLRADEQGSVRPSALVQAALGKAVFWKLEAASRVRLAPDSEEG